MKEGVYEKIIQDFKKLQEYHDIIDQHNKNNYDPYDDSGNNGIPIEEVYDFDIRMLEVNLEENFKKLYNYSLSNNFYYFDCPSKVYINEFEKRKEKFFKTNIDAEELDFLKDEIEYFCSPRVNRVIGDNQDFNYDKYIIEPKKYKFSLQRKIDFLTEKINKIGFNVVKNEPEPIYDSFYNIKTDVEPFYSLEPILKENLINEAVLNTSIKTTSSNDKLITDLSVPQLSLLFKMINDLKPQIFKTESNAELFRFISANFKTKKSSEKGISENKLRNEFSCPDLKAIEFWETHLRTMLSELKKTKNLK
ncbi:hypothetical protein [uncultured Polaribacter sp.]|uniref:hypothetical protein n=1 Tax=uncultured Polaribacter sp. TaxID=174711 RepID=UPI00259BA8EF|nr:hypothetical protein [uncultured Polaribacter sp.]